MQAAQADIASLTQTHEAAILKEEKAAEAALAAGAAQHKAALEKHQQKLRDIHVTYEAAIAAEWAEFQKTGRRQAAFLKVNHAAHTLECSDALLPSLWLKSSRW